jgi:hypothetical protein
MDVEAIAPTLRGIMDPPYANVERVDSKYPSDDPSPGLVAFRGQAA